MKSKFLFAILILFLVFAVNSQVDAANVSDKVEELPTKMVGIDLPNYGWAETNEQGQITGYEGFNVGLGYSKKNYFEPGLKINQFNPYWGWGTVVLILPYIEAGGDYVLEPNANDEFWSFGGAVGLYALVPSIRVNATYHF